MQTEQVENTIKNQSQNFLQSFIGSLKKSFTFKGRATRKEFWTFIVISYIILILAVIPAVIIPFVFLPIFWLIYLWLFIASISLMVRRLHDIGLSGFWIWYLNPFGMPVIFVVYLLELDSTCDKVINRIKGIGSPWLGWILTFLLWPAGSCAALWLLSLYKGQERDNEFGPNPYIG